MSFSKIHTPLTYTAISVPQILTNNSVSEKSNENNYSIYSILNKLNYETTWIGNQSPEKSYRHFINENKNINIIDKFRSVLSFNKEKDSSMIPLFKDSFKKSNKQFFTLHMIGSHWYYKNRISEKFQVFQPEIRSKYIPSNTLEEMINSYDNTIVYLDYFLSEIISTIEDSSTNTLLIYLSDHGEILGENGKWLHAQNDIASQNPAMIIWYSNEFLNQFPNLISSLNKNSNKEFTTDFFYHSILDLLEVQNQEIELDQSVFRNNCLNSN